MPSVFRLIARPQKMILSEVHAIFHRHERNRSVASRKPYFDNSLQKQYQSFLSVMVLQVPECKISLQFCSALPHGLFSFCLQDKTEGNPVESINQFGLLVFDECHHCMKNHAYNVVMQEYFKLKRRFSSQQQLPQVLLYKRNK